ncbi:sterile alpha motif domain-containing protein 9-like [Physella acuta]|uniref:sterile alpha motif domain-containing protein 9-like n=1 Tax=Physella acuta TaxID=109671 RepID=UPI0027DAE521|nr:sterile alpha motif domain-containing protein 9-like [Physella acuta]
MDAPSKEKISKNMVKLCELPILSLKLLPHLHQKEIISQDEWNNVKACTNNRERMKTLLEILYQKPKGYEQLIEGLRLDPHNIADEIENTVTTADPSLKSCTDPSELDPKIRSALLESLINKSGECAYLSEVKELLKKKMVIEQDADYSEERLLQLIQKTFTAVIEIKKERRISRWKIPDVYLRNIGMKKDGNVSAIDDQANDYVYNFDCTADEVKKFKTDELMTFIEKHLLEHHLETGCLDLLRAEQITGRVFLVQNFESLKELLKEFSIDIMKCLSDLITRVKNPFHNLRKPLETQNLRKFGSNYPNKNYSIKRKLPVTRNINGPLTQPIRNFHLVEEQELDDALEFIASEFIPFASACLNERQDGTIYFGVSPTDSDKYQAGEIVGIKLPQKDILQRKIDVFLQQCFDDSNRELISKMFHGACCVPVADDVRSDLYVVEIDILVSSTLLNDYTIYTQMEYLPIYHEKSKRLQDEKRVHEKKKNLGVRLKTLLGVGSSGSTFIFCLISPDDAESRPDELESKVSFIQNLKPRCVFDFATRSEGLFKSLDERQDDIIRVSVLDDYDPTRRKNEHDCKQERDLRKREISWVFCYGYESFLPKNTIDWKKNRRTKFQHALDLFSVKYSVIRTIVVICLFSEHYETLLEAFDLAAPLFEGRWCLICKNEDIANRFIEQIKNRRLGDEKNIKERCVVGLSWQQIDETLLSSRPSRANIKAFEPCASGAEAEVEKSYINRWSDIDVLTSKELDYSDVDSNEKKEEVLKRFYQGEEVDWWNFYFGDQVLTRDVHDDLMANVRDALSIPDDTEEVHISEVTLLHEPGAGGTTAAKQVLWELRKQWRCCVIKSITDQTADQLWELRKFKDSTPNPVLVLIDNPSDEDVEDLKGSLNQKIGDNTASSSSVYFTLIRCERRTEIPTSTPHIAIRHKLTERELSWLSEKSVKLEVDFQSKLSDVNPQFLISFNIMKNNFDQSYISQLVKTLTESITDVKEVKLMTIMSFINSYDSRKIPVHYLDCLMLESSLKDGDNSSDSQWSRSPYGEQLLSDAVNALLNTTRTTDGTDVTLRIFCKLVAKEILLLMKDRTGQQESEIMLEILNSDIDVRGPFLKEIIKPIIHSRENLSGDRREDFSEFVKNLRTEGADVTVKVMKKLYELNENPTTAQLLARFYLSIEELCLAKQYATKAVEKWSDNSHLIDTLGIVYLHELFKMVKECKTVNNDQLRKISTQCWLTCHTFQNGQKISEKGADNSKQNSKQNIKQNIKQNLACHFNELKTIASFLSFVESQGCSLSDMRHFLVDPDAQTSFFSFFTEDDIKCIKSLQTRYEKVMRRLDEEYLSVDTSKGKPKDSFRQNDLIELKAKLDRFFTEYTDDIPSNLFGASKCEWRWRRARTLGAVSIKSLLQIRRDGDKLNRIYQLMLDNLRERNNNFNDYRTILQTILVLMLENQVPNNLIFEDVLEWSKRYYSMTLGTELMNLDWFFFFVLFNFPTKNRVSFPLVFKADLATALSNWRTAINQHNFRHSTKNELHKVVWFLGNRNPAYDIVPVYEENEIYRNSYMLYLSKGILSKGGRSVKIITEDNDGVTLKIETNKHEQNHDRWMKSVQFYIGFSFTGPKAFLI